MPKQAPRRGFPTTEFETRLSRAHKLMRQLDMGALWLTTEPEIRYFTGFLTQFWQSPTRPWFLVLPIDRKPIAVIPEIGAECMAATWIEDIRTWPSPAPEDDGVSLLGLTLRETVGRTGTVGILKGLETHLHMPLGNYELLHQTLTHDGIEFADATPIGRELRMVKSTAEIEKIGYVCKTVSDAFAELPFWAASGDKEDELFRRFKIDILSRGADDVPYLVGGAGPDGYNNIISPPSTHTMKSGDIFMMDTGSLFDGYFCDFDRNFAFGRPSDVSRSAYNLLYLATEAGIKTARAGVTAATVFHSMQQVLEGWGGSESGVGRFGHGLGMQLTEWPSLAPWDQTMLQADMVITLEPSLYVSPGRMMVHEENIVIKEDGTELLTKRTPRELMDIG